MKTGELVKTIVEAGGRAYIVIEITPSTTFRELEELFKAVEKTKKTAYVIPANMKAPEVPKAPEVGTWIAV